ncbi:mechanosensitive ion channel [Hydrogenophaga sp. 5NK40-0174]|uniref:mechanosensitive ion channel n=1 Tax=Hydrogenophaga sp. 5NK40-0174 TaxID=3127649 RepID=UPI0031093A1C
MSNNALWNSLQNSLGGDFPALLGALGILVIGWIIAVVVRAGVRKGLGAISLNEQFEKITGTKINISGAVALAAFWAILLFTLMAVFNQLNLTVVSGPFSAMMTEIMEYAPKLGAGLILAVVAWVVASIVRSVSKKALDSTSLDEKLAKEADMKPVGQGLSNALFWLVILLFLPIILGALGMHGLLTPLTSMLDKVLSFLPNILTAVVIGGVGWIVATVLRNVVTNLSATAGIDKLGATAGADPKVKFSNIAGLLAFIVVFVPSLISALDALQIEAISGPATNMLDEFMSAIPDIFGATAIVVVTWFVASFVSKLLATLLASIGFDTFPERIGMAKPFEKTPASTVVGRVVFFFAMLFAAVSAANVLGFVQVSAIVSTFILFGGDILLGSAILIIGFWLSNVAYNAIKSAGSEGSSTAANIARYAILALVLAMGLRAMGIADDIVNLAFGLTLGAIAVAVALSFGLGGREAAGKLMDHWLSKFIKK